MIKLTQLINELGINKPMQIIPTDMRNGWIKFNEHQVEYNYMSDNVNIDLFSDYSIWGEYDPGNTDEDYYPVKESLQACKYYIPLFKTFFGNGVFIGQDGYGCSIICVPKDLFNKRLNSFKKSIIEYLGNGKFQYKGNILILKELTPKELKIEKDKFIQYYYKTYPHMKKYNKKDEEIYQFSSSFSNENKIYYILDKDRNILKSMYNPAKDERNSIFSIPKDDNIEDYSLDLIKYFEYYFK